MSRLFLSAAIAVPMAFAAVAEESKPVAEMGDAERGALEEIAHRLSFTAYADVESAYWARGAIVDKNPFSAQYVDLSFDLEPFGRIGGYAWSVSSMAKSGQSATRRNFYNEVDYGVYYGYTLEITEDWALDTTVAKKWVTLPGYRPHAASISEWNVSQALRNPYVTPYYLLRRAVHGQEWCYWDVGLTRSWELLEGLVFTATLFGEFGDSRHFAAQFGDRPGGGNYSNGLMALNAMFRFDYALTDWLGLFAFVHQFDMVSQEARDSLSASTAPEAKKDLTMFGAGVQVKF